MRHAGTGLEVRGITDAAGVFRALALPPGTYEWVVIRDGFRQYRREGIILRSGAFVRLEAHLELGEVPQAVEVVADAPLLQSDRASLSYVIEAKKAVELPLDGRNFVPLVALLPGVSLPPGSTLPRINGGRPRVSEYLYDGVSVLQPEPGQVAYFPILDAIEEFRVDTNSYPAEFGRANGGVIQVRQRSGGNAFHGTLFEFFRNEALNSRNLFAPTGQAKPLFRRQQYGFVLGGPVQRNRTFFFVAWQGTRQSSGVIRLSTVPGAGERRGQFAVPVFDPRSTRQDANGWSRLRFPSDRIPPSLWDPAAAVLAGRYPAPNLGGTANNFRRVGAERIAQDQFDTRLDRYFGERHRVFGRYSYLRDFSRPVTPLPDGSGAIPAGIIGNTRTRAGSVVAEYTAAPSATWSNQLRFGYTRRGLERVSLAGEPTYDAAGLQLLGPPMSGNARLETSVAQWFDKVTWSTSRNTFYLGADLRRQTLDALQPASPFGNFQFGNLFTAALTAAGTPQSGTGSSFADFLMGQVQSFQIDLQPGFLSPRARIAEFFYQQDTRLTPRLTVNLGVRYTLNFPSTVKGNQGAVFDLDSQQLRLLGRDGYPRTARNLETANFGPRLGLAWRVAAGLVLRAGYGLTWIEQAGITTPFTTPLFPFIRTLSQPSLDNIRPAILLAQGPSLVVDPPGPDSGLGQSTFAVQRDQKSGYAQQWNLAVQKTLGNHWSVEAAYVGSKLTNLGVPDGNLNQLTVEQLGLGGVLAENVENPFFGQIPVSSVLGRSTIARQQLLRPFPRFTSVSLYRNNTGHSTYHSLQTRLERRFARGLTFSASYTFSRLIDDAGAVFDAAILAGPVAAFQAADSFNRRLEKDVSTGNMPHVFASGFVWQRHGGRRMWQQGWSLAGIVRLQSGMPVAVLQQPNRNAFAGFGIQRPNRLRDPNLAASGRTTARWFDTGAFSVAPQFTIGNSSRNPVRGPGYRTFDLMIGKQFPLREQVRLELRAEAFNLTNTPPLTNPNGSFGTPAFGTIPSALDPRVFELVAKIHF